MYAHIYIYFVVVYVVLLLCCLCFCLARKVIRKFLHYYLVMMAGIAGVATWRDQRSTNLFCCCFFFFAVLLPVISDRPKAQQNVDAAAAANLDLRSHKFNRNSHGYSTFISTSSPSGIAAAAHSNLICITEILIIAPLHACYIRRIRGIKKNAEFS